MSAALQVITDVAVVLSHDDRPHLLPEAREVVLAVLRLRVAGTQLGQQDVSLVHQVVLAGQPVPQGGAALATLLAGPVSLAHHWQEERQEKVFSSVWTDTRLPALAEIRETNNSENTLMVTGLVNDLA